MNVVFSHKKNFIYLSFYRLWFPFQLAKKTQQKKGPLTKNIVMIKLSLETGLWKVLKYLVVSSACKFVFRCDFYFWWVVHLIIKILRHTLLLKFRNNCFLREVYPTAFVTHSVPPFEFVFWLHLFTFFDAFHYSSAL